MTKRIKGDYVHLTIPARNWLAMEYIFLCKKCYDPVTPKVPCVNCGSKRDIILRKGPEGWKDMRTTEEYKRVTPRQGQRILGNIRDEITRGNPT